MPATAVWKTAPAQKARTAGIIGFEDGIYPYARMPAACPASAMSMKKPPYRLNCLRRRTGFKKPARSW